MHITIEENRIRIKILVRKLNAVIYINGLTSTSDFIDVESVFEFSDGDNQRVCKKCD